MTVLVLRLAAPMQSWGAASRFVRRTTEPAPTKSGIIGLLAAAQGRRRTDSLEDLLPLRLGVRVDQSGRLIRDFQTAVQHDGKPLPLSYRYYLGDAVFCAAVEAADPLLQGLHEALHHPQFPLYLGRRSCPPAGPVTLGLRDGDVHSVLRNEPWLAAPGHQRQTRSPTVRLATIVDCAAGTPGSETIRDEPLSFDPQRREYGWRSIRRDHVWVDNPQTPPGASDPFDHDPLAVLGG